MSLSHQAFDWQSKSNLPGFVVYSFLKSIGRMVSVFPWNNKAIFHFVFRRLLHVHMLVSIE